jgi:hypothetical protein
LILGIVLGLALAVETVAGLVHYRKSVTIFRGAP